MEKKDQSGPQLPISFQLLGSLSRRCGTCAGNDEKGVERGDFLERIGIGGFQNLTSTSPARGH